MNSIRFKSFLVATLALSLSSNVLAQRGRERPIEVIKITDSVYMLVGQQSGNIGLCVGEDGTFMIDDQFAKDTGKILAAAATVTDDPIKYLLNTHWHGDHTGGNENFHGEGALLIAQENVYVRMSMVQFNELRHWDRSTPASPEAARPNITFSKELIMRFNGDEIHAFHIPHAHTDGDTIVHFRKNNVIHMGDTYFNKMYPFIDVSSGGSVDGIIVAADAVLALANDETKIIPGHGPLSDAKELKAYRDLLIDVRGNVAKLIAEGKSKDEVVAAKPSAKYDEQWGNGFIKPDVLALVVYESLVGVKK